jgi:hypothetical protein
MTSIGRFSLESETITNPSIPTFFIALSGSKPLTAQRFGQLWEERGMATKHPRFHHAVSPTHKGFFQPTQELQISDTLAPQVYREDLKCRIESCLTHPLQVTDALWQVQLSSGNMGTSGAISKIKATRLLSREVPHFRETILLFRGHHALADGVSLTAAFSDLCDEAQEIQNAIRLHLQRRQGPSRTFFQKLVRFLKRLAWFCHGSVKAMWHHMYLLLFTPNNPFDSLKQFLLPTNITTTTGRRTVSWCDAAPLDQVKQVAHFFGPRVTVNDVIVSCVTYAVAQQLEQHRQHLEAVVANQVPEKRKHSTINVVIPVHLGGGVLLPGQPVGNNIGAFCAQVPGESNDTSAEARLRLVHDSLYSVKNTPAPLLSFLFAKMTSMLPFFVTRTLFEKSQAHACVAITNNRGSPQKLHLDGQEIESIAGFLPLPPGIPIGVSVTSYAGTVSLSVTAEPWAVPNADQFITWMLQEYRRLQQAAAEK